MKVKSVKSIYLNQGELKEAIVLFLESKGTKEAKALAEHLQKNACEFEWSKGDCGRDDLAIDMDGSWEE